jgi:hypothetical protein
MYPPERVTALVLSGQGRDQGCVLDAAGIEPPRPAGGTGRPPAPPARSAALALRRCRPVDGGAGGRRFRSAVGL